MDSLQTIILLMFAAAILVGMAQKLHIPYPIALVLSGTLIGFIPGLKAIYFDPNLLLLVVLPPILYYAAYGISFREFKKNWRTIFSLSLGLVVVTTIVIGMLFKWIFPEFSWALAFAFGAIVSPPDAVAATTILKRFAIGSRLLTILEGESLVNDASALVLYRLAVTAILSGTFSIAEGSFDFIKIVSGGIIIGCILGVLIQLFSRHYLDPIVGVVFSFTIPYITYVLANSLGVSGVLAVVIVGLIGSHVLLTHHSSLRRVIGYATWDIFIIFMNCFIFILIGLQLRTFTNLMTIEQILLFTGYAFLFTFVMIAVRMVWIYAKIGIAYLKTRQRFKIARISPRNLRDAALVGWSGMRGIVSLTAALALPLTLPDGTPLEGRNEVVFMTFMVILFTLIIPGFTLPALIRRLKIPYHSEHHGAHKVRKQLAKVAEEKLQHLQNSQTLDEDELKFLTTYFSLQLRVLEISTPLQKTLSNLEVARLDVIHAQRQQLLEIWERHEIDDRLLTHLEQELDAQETHTVRAELL